MSKNIFSIYTLKDKKREKKQNAFKIETIRSTLKKLSSYMQGLWIIISMCAGKGKTDRYHVLSRVTICVMEIVCGIGHLRVLPVSTLSDNTVITRLRVFPCTWGTDKGKTINVALVPVIKCIAPSVLTHHFNLCFLFIVVRLFFLHCLCRGLYICIIQKKKLVICKNVR